MCWIYLRVKRRRVERNYLELSSSDEALKATGFKWKSPIPPNDDDDDEDEEVEDDMEVDLDKVEETMAGHYSDEDEGDVLHIDEYSPTLPIGGATEDGVRIGQIMESRSTWNLLHDHLMIPVQHRRGHLAS